MPVRREIKEILAALDRAEVKYIWNPKTSHYRVFGPDGEKMMTIPSTPNRGRRTMENIRKDVRRVTGVEV